MNPQALARSAIKSPRLLPEVLEGLSAKAARARYDCAKALRIVGERRPDLLYPHYEFFVRLLRHENKIFQWQGALVLSLLAGVDTRDKFAGVFGRYFGPIRGPVMITAANVMRGAPRIARAKPHLADRIAAKLLQVSRARYQTPECRNVASGHAITALGEFVDLLRKPAPVVRFVRTQLKNPRPATRKKAAQFLKRFAAKT